MAKSFSLLNFFKLALFALLYSFTSLFRHVVGTSLSKLIPQPEIKHEKKLLCLLEHHLEEIIIHQEFLDINDLPILQIMFDLLAEHVTIKPPILTKPVVYKSLGHFK